MLKSNKIKNVIFMGRKPGAASALEYLVKKGFKVALVVAPKNESGLIKLEDVAKKYVIPVYHEIDQVYRLMEKTADDLADVDLVISYLFWKKIKLPLIRLAKRGCINFHPAPLPDYKGRAGYNTAILEEKKHFGVSAHFIDSEEFDSGPIIDVLRFPIRSKHETAFSLERKTQEKLLELFKKTIDKFCGQNIIKVKNNVGGTYWTRQNLEDAKVIDFKEKKFNADEIKKKIRAFFFPPYSGAKIKIDDEYFTLIDDQILKYIHQLINEKH